MATKETVPSDPAQEVGLADSNTSGLAPTPKVAPKNDALAAAKAADKAEEAAREDAEKKIEAENKRLAKAEADKVKARKAELAEREELVKEGKRVFQEEPTGVFDFEPVTADHAVQTPVNVRATQHGETE